MKAVRVSNVEKVKATVTVFIKLAYAEARTFSETKSSMIWSGLLLASC